jgi:hypothetical protein
VPTRLIPLILPVERVLNRGTVVSGAKFAELEHPSEPFFVRTAIWAQTFRG